MPRHGGSSTSRRDNAAFPTRQMAVLALCRLCEPIAFMSIFPYVYHMVKSFDQDQSPAKINMYVGMVTSAFAFAECLSGIFWGRLSDRIGRKKVLLGGLFGTGLSMLLFGFAKSLPMALIARALGGLLNGNIGVLQTTVAEIITREEHKPRAYSIMPFVWCIGTIIGSSLGGLLADPVKNWPGLGFENTIFESYRFLLPNLVCAAVVVFGLAVGILFLEETHEDLKYEQDRGREVGQWILQKVWNHEGYVTLSDKDEPLDETRSILDGHSSHAYRSTDSSPTLCSSRSSIASVPLLSLENDSQPPPKLRDAFTKQICLNIISYGILAFHTISLEQLLPGLMSHKEPTEKEVTQLPFKFQGGFAYSERTIGTILAVQGILQMIAQVLLFPWINKRLGSLRTFWLTIATYPFLYFLTPYLAFLPKQFRIPGMILVLVWKVTAQSLSYPSLTMMLNHAASSTKVLGTLNGAAASSASVCRGFGPTVTGAVATIGDGMGVSGLAWWTCAGIALLAWIPGSLMREEPKRQGSCVTEEDEEAGYSEAEADMHSDAGSDTASVVTLTPYETVGAVLSK